MRCRFAFCTSATADVDFASDGAAQAVVGIYCYVNARTPPVADVPLQAASSASASASGATPQPRNNAAALHYSTSPADTSTTFSTTFSSDSAYSAAPPPADTPSARA